jgi:hypothetical protein
MAERNYQRANRPVVPMIAGIVVVDIGKTTVVGMATVEAVRSALEILSAFVYVTAP